MRVKIQVEIAMIRNQAKISLYIDDWWKIGIAKFTSISPQPTPQHLQGFAVVVAVVVSAAILHLSI